LRSGRHPNRPFQRSRASSNRASVSAERDHGAFPELIERTGGGLLVAPDAAPALADGLLALIDDPERRRRLGQSGRAAVREHFNSDAMTTRTHDIYPAVVAAAADA
jgi:glycosyltransferase involved in cell wall biosynthesis